MTCSSRSYRFYIYCTNLFQNTNSPTTQAETKNAARGQEYPRPIHVHDVRRSSPSSQSSKRKFTVRRNLMFPFLFQRVVLRRAKGKIHVARRRAASARPRQAAGRADSPCGADALLPAALGDVDGGARGGGLQRELGAARLADGARGRALALGYRARDAPADAELCYILVVKNDVTVVEVVSWLCLRCFVGGGVLTGSSRCTLRLKLRLGSRWSRRGWRVPPSARCLSRSEAIPG